MKYESENIRITDEMDGLDPKIETQINRIKAKFADILNEEKCTMDIALSIMATMYVVTCQRMAGVPKEIALEAITGAIEMQYAEDDDEEDNEGEIKWLN